MSPSLSPLLNKLVERRKVVGPRARRKLQRFTIEPLDFETPTFRAPSYQDVPDELRVRRLLQPKIELWPELFFPLRPAGSGDREEIGDGSGDFRVEVIGKSLGCGNQVGLHPLVLGLTHLTEPVVLKRR